MSAPALPATGGTTTNGDMVLLFVIWKYGSGTGSVSANTPTDWTLVANTSVANSGLTNGSNDEGNVGMAVYYRIKDAGWSTMPAVDLTGTPNCTMRGAISYSLGGGESWDTPTGASAADNSVSNTGCNPAASGTTIALASGDWLISFGSVNGDLGTLGTHTCTVSGVTFGSSNTRLDGTTSSGTDLRGHVIDMAYSSGTASAGPDGALPVTGGDTNGAGVMSFIRLRLAAGDVNETPDTIARSFTVNTPTVTASADITPATIACAFTLNTPTPTESASPTPDPIAVTSIVRQPYVTGHADGPFTIDFSIYSDGPIPAATGLRDMFLDYPDSQDEMGIVSGKLAVVDFRGPDQDFVDGGGRRGLAWRNTRTLTDDVRARYDGSMYTGSDPDLPAFGGTLHIDTESTYLGISAWFVPPPFQWAELGLIGKAQEDFSYLEIQLATVYPEPTDEILLRSVDGFVAVEVNGETILGPCEIPAELLGSPVHGVQIDVAADTDEGLGVMDGVIIEADSTPLTTERAAPAILGVGTAVETASSTTIDVPYPSGIQAGEHLYCVIAPKNGGTVSATDWDVTQTNFGVVASISGRVLHKVATGSESGNLTVTKSTAGIMAGVMFRVDKQWVGFVSGQGNSSASTDMPAPAQTIFGQRQTAVWIGASNADGAITLPDGFTSMSTGVSGGQTIRLALGWADVDTHADGPAPPFNAYTSSGNFASQSGTGSSATSAVGVLMLYPAVAPASSAQTEPDPVAVTSAVNTPTVTAGAEITPATVARAFAINTPTVTASAEVTPATVARAFTVNTPTVVESSEVTPATVARAFTVNTPTVTAGAEITPATVARAFALNTPTVTASANVTPTTVARVFTVNTPTVTASTDATPATIARVLTVNTPSPTATSNVTPATVARSFTVNAPTVTASADVVPAPVPAAVTVQTPSATASSSMTPATVARSFTLNAPSVTASAEITPAPVNRAFALNTPSHTATANITPDAIARVFVVQSPTVTTGEVALPAAIARTFTVPTPPVTAGSQITPTTIARAFTLNTPTVTATGTRTPAPVAGIFTHNNPAPTATSTVTPSPVARVFALPTPSVTASANVTPAVIARDWNVSTPAITASANITPATLNLVFVLPLPTPTDTTGVISHVAGVSRTSITHINNVPVTSISQTAGVPF
jgi:hypothetical protein